MQLFYEHWPFLSLAYCANFNFVTKEMGEDF
jgi:hypothetical protein